jgi:hypothetical protein
MGDSSIIPVRAANPGTVGLWEHSMLISDRVGVECL